jgi:hypothetical protein
MVRTRGGRKCNLVAPSSDHAGADDRLRREVVSKAYGSFIASPHRSHGIQSTLGQPAGHHWNSYDGVFSAVAAPVRSSPNPPSMSLLAAAVAAAQQQHAASPSTEELYVKYSQSFSRRSEHRASLYPSSCPSSSSSSSHHPSSSSSTGSLLRRERQLVHPDARGKLLVPDVKLKARRVVVGVSGASNASLASCWSPASRAGSSTSGSTSSGSENAEARMTRPAGPVRRETVPCVPRRPVVESELLGVFFFWR